MSGIRGGLSGSFAAKAAAAAPTIFAKVGTFTLNTTTGNQAITGLGFAPKAVQFIFTGKDIADGAVNELLLGMGAGTSSSSRWVNWARVQDSVVTTVEKRLLATDKVISVSASGTTILTDADLVSLDSDGFTINVTTATNTRVVSIGYIAYGGTGLSAKATTFNIAASTGNQAFTGIGFQPNAELFAGSISNTTVGTVAGTAVFSTGCAVSTTKRWVSGICSGGDGLGTSTYFRNQNSALAFARYTSGASPQEADFVSHDSDGFTLNFTTSTNAPTAAVLAFAGASVFAGSVAINNSTGSQSVTGFGFAPKVVIFVSYEASASGSQRTQGRITIGAASGNSNQFCFSTAGSAGATSNVGVFGSSALCYGALTSNVVGLPPNANNQASFTSLDADGFTINWTSMPTGSSSTELLYFALG